MSFPQNNQCILCDVSSCQHYSKDGKCRLETIQVSPRDGCNSGKCDESLCSSYDVK